MLIFLSQYLNRTRAFDDEPWPRAIESKDHLRSPNWSEEKGWKYLKVFVIHEQSQNPYIQLKLTNYQTAETQGLPLHAFQKISSTFSPLAVSMTNLPHLTVNYACFCGKKAWRSPPWAPWIKHVFSTQVACTVLFLLTSSDTVFLECVWGFQSFLLRGIIHHLRKGKRLERRSGVKKFTCLGLLLLIQN